MDTIGYIAYVLVFAAVAAIAWLVWSSVAAAGLAEEGRRDFENNVNADGRQKTPLERFVSPGRLFRLQLVFSAVPATLVVVLFLAGGIVSPVIIVAFAAIVGYAGWRLVRVYFNVLVKKRQAKFEAGLLDLTAGLANSLKAGMAFPQALERISSRMTGPMKEELAIVLREYRLGLDMPTSIDRLVERMPCEDIRLIASAVRLTTSTGGSLADVLQEMTEMIRGRRDFAERLKAVTAQGRFEGIVLGSMPVLAFVIFYIIQPDIMSTLFETEIGWVAIGIAAILEVCGYMVISRITKIEV